MLFLTGVTKVARKRVRTGVIPLLLSFVLKSLTSSISIVEVLRCLSLIAFKRLWLAAGLFVTLEIESAVLRKINLLRLVIQNQYKSLQSQLENCFAKFEANYLCLCWILLGIRTKFQLWNFVSRPEDILQIVTAGQRFLWTKVLESGQYNASLRFLRNTLWFHKWATKFFLEVRLSQTAKFIKNPKLFITTLSYKLGSNWL